MSNALLPIAEGPELRAHARILAQRHRGALVGVIALHGLAAAAGLAAPALLGSLVQSVVDGTTRSHIDTVVLVLAGFIVLQTILTWFARRASFVLSELMFAELREDFMRQVLALPLSTVERAGTGDLISRTTADLESLARTVRFAIPETLIAVVITTLTVGAAIWVSPPVALSLVAGVPALWIGTRWYLRRAPQGYLWERAAYAKLAGSVGETVDGGLTIEALGLDERRILQLDDELRDAYRAERYTLRLRMYWFPTAEISYVVPVVAGLLWGGWLVQSGHASIGEVTAIVLYAQQLADPVDRLVSWLDEIQVGAASLARLVGISSVPPDRTASDREPDGLELTARDVRYAYVADRDVLHGIDLDLRPGERVAVVGPSGAGKSTLGRLLAGIHPPRTGKVEVGGVRLVELPLEALRREVALITQEQHVFVGPLADNLRLARPEATLIELEAALDAVDALEWAHALPDGLETPVGAGGVPLTPPQTQQLALARLVLADPHTLSSTKRPRCSTRAQRGTWSGLSARCSMGAQWSRSHTGSTRRTTLTASPSSRTGCYARWAPTTSSWTTAVPTLRSGNPGDPDATGRGSLPAGGAGLRDPLAPLAAPGSPGPFPILCPPPGTASDAPEAPGAVKTKEGPNSDPYCADRAPRNPASRHPRSARRPMAPLGRSGRCRLRGGSARQPSDRATKRRAGAGRHRRRARAHRPAVRDQPHNAAVCRRGVPGHPRRSATGRIVRARAIRGTRGAKS